MDKKAVFWVLLLFFLLQGSAYSGGTQDTLVVLSRRVILLNFVNGLNPTPGQMDSLFNLANLAEQLRRDHMACTSDARSAHAEALAELELELLFDRPVSEDLARRVHKTKKDLEDRDLDLRRELKGLEERVSAVLTPNQEYLAETFKACLIPPKAGVIGQDGSDVPAHLEKLLQRLRRVPESQYPRFRDRIVLGYIDKIEHEVAALGDEERAEKIDALRSVLDQMRGMDEARFLAELPEIAERFRLERRKPRLRKYELTRIGRLCLDPQMVYVLEKKICGEY